MSNKIDSLDALILQKLQSDFPVQQNPFAILGQDLGLSEQEVLTRVQNLKTKGLIRRIGANFDSRKLGCYSTLCAAKVPNEQLKFFIDAVNAEPGVTHNYLRDHEYNIWFTLIGKNKDAVEQQISKLKKKAGVEIINLPAQKVYKLKVNFKLDKSDHY